MLQTAEDPVTLEKVDQGEEMPLSGLVMYACVSVCAQENTHTLYVQTRAHIALTQT